MEQHSGDEATDSFCIRCIATTYLFERCLCAAVFCVCIFHVASFGQGFKANPHVMRNEYQFACIHNMMCGITEIDWDSSWVIPAFTLIWKNRSETTEYAGTAWPSATGRDECLALCEKNHSCTGYSWRGWLQGHHNFTDCLHWQHGACNVSSTLGQLWKSCNGSNCTTCTRMRSERVRSLQMLRAAGV
ncbi:unnamed protein product [Symbiodinium necroappetens]|uniref:Uncharacterized protein n=1 Tax=Symbiodinium necroappetens TaxID=1628268 RepID=A0A812IR25_9DINO|nr:unnamed protein product [Symbiodinium necroappetens]